MDKVPKIVILIICFALVAFFSFRVGFRVGEESGLKVPPPQIVGEEDGKPEEVDFSLFWEAWKKLERKYLEKDEINYQNMVYGAIRGMVASLEDPYTVFFKPQETEELQEELSGKYEGVGMEISVRDGQLVVISPLENTPAMEAGIRPGDKILMINDTYTQDLPVEEAARLIRGPRGTEVTLTVYREKWPEPKEITLKRELIKIPTLKWELKDENIAWVRIYQFNQIITTEFKKATLEILNSKVEKIILDLRNNPGGYLDKAQEIAGWFLEEGDVVVWQDSGKEKERKSYRSYGPSTFIDYPTVILINKGSASGAEILAGALRDQRNIKLIGETSFGKGSVQEQVFLSDGSSLKVTTSKWLTPKGDSIDDNGLEPDIEVEMTDEDFEEEKDPQLEEAIEILNSLE